MKMQNDRSKTTNLKHEIQNPKQYQITNDQNPNKMSFGIRIQNFGFVWSLEIRI